MKGGRIVLVLRDDCRFSQLLREHGFEVVNLEVISTKPIADREILRERLDAVHEYDGLFFTSPVSARVFVEWSASAAKRYSRKIYALGPRAKRELEAGGFEVSFKPEAETAEDLMNQWGAEEFDGKRFLFLRGGKSLRAIPERLSWSATVDELVVYETIELKLTAAELEHVADRIDRGSIDWMCFFSPSAVDSFMSQFSFAGQASASIAAIGPTTAERLRSYGLPVNFVSPRAAAEDFARGLVEHIDEIS